MTMTERAMATEAEAEQITKGKLKMTRGEYV